MPPEMSLDVFAATSRCCLIISLCCCRAEIKTIRCSWSMWPSLNFFADMECRNKCLSNQQVIFQDACFRTVASPTLPVGFEVGASRHLPCHSNAGNESNTGLQQPSWKENFTTTTLLCQTRKPSYLSYAFTLYPSFALTNRDNALYKLHSKVLDFEIVEQLLQ